MSNADITVYVGMSGGVDSSVTAALVKEQGYSVVGVYMKNWAQDLPGFDCPWRDDLADAKRVAVQLDIPFKVFDFQDQYRQKVVEYMLESYKQGLTPNPDIMCNQEIKFKVFLEAALEDGADMIATGHYARIRDGQLHTAADISKDQTYFLYRMPKESLEKTLFPLGDMQKTDVRARAQELGLVTAIKKESMGICFVGKVGIREFLSQFIDTEPGDIVSTSGEVLGRHDGAIFYTIGQRHGLDVGGGLPLYVVAKDMEKNQVIVTSDINDADLWSSAAELQSCHWLGDAPVEDKTYAVRTRHLGELHEVLVTKDDEKTARVTFNETIRALTPGQSAVLYDGTRVVGGGIMGKMYNKA